MKCELCNLDSDGRKQRIVYQEVGSHQTRKHFCSQRCLKRWQCGCVPARCRNCFDPFPGKFCRSLRAWGQKMAFCSSDCRAVFRLRERRTVAPGKSRSSLLVEMFHANERPKTGWKKERPGWSRVRQLVKSRDSYSCQACAAARAESILQVDHIVPYLLSQVDDPRNLLTLCVRCHGFKTDVLEPRLFLGRVGYFLIGLRRGGWPMATVKAAMKLYSLPTHERKRPMPRCWVGVRWLRD